MSTLKLLASTGKTTLAGSISVIKMKPSDLGSWFPKIIFVSSQRFIQVRVGKWISDMRIVDGYRHLFVLFGNQFILLSSAWLANATIVLAKPWETWYAVLRNLTASPCLSKAFVFKISIHSSNDFLVFSGILAIIVSSCVLMLNYYDGKVKLFENISASSLSRKLNRSMREPNPSHPDGPTPLSQPHLRCRKYKRKNSTWWVLHGWSHLHLAWPPFF